MRRRVVTYFEIVVQHLGQKTVKLFSIFWRDQPIVECSSNFMSQQLRTQISIYNDIFTCL